MVQIRFTAAALVAAAVIAPAVAYSAYPEDSLAARDYNDVDEFYAREFDEDFEAREYDSELFERDPFLGWNHVKKWIANKKAKQAAAAGDDGSYEAREFEDEELLTREFAEHFERDLEELMERDPLFGWKKIKGWFSGKKNQQQQQEPADNYNDAREYEEDIEARDFEEDIEAREPEYEEVLERYFDDLYERELGSEDELLERELSGESELAEREYDDDLFERDSEELFTREPGLKEWWHNLWHPKKAAVAKPPVPSAPAATPAAGAKESEDSSEAREIDELD